MAQLENKQVVDFNKLRKKRQRATAVRRLLILAGLLVVVLLAVFLNTILVQESFTTRISDLVNGIGGSGYPVPLPGGVIRDVKSSGNNLAVLNDTNLYIYNAKGKQVGNFQKMTENTVLLTGSGRFLTYESQSQRYGVYSTSKTLHTQESEYGIITAGMNDRGDYAVVSSSKQAICEINVYNKQFDRIYWCTFAENIVHHVSLAPKGTLMAAGWINGQDGALYSGVKIFMLGSNEEQAAFDLPDRLILDLRFQEENRIAVLTDQDYLVADASGAVKHRYHFGGRQVAAVEYDGKQTLLLLENRETRSGDAVLLGAELEELAAYSTQEKVLDMALTGKRIYLLQEDAIYTFDRQFHPVESGARIEVQHVSRIQSAGNSLYYLTGEEIRVLGYTEEEESRDDPVNSGDDAFRSDTGDSAVGREKDNPISNSAGEEWESEGEFSGQAVSEEDDLPEEESA